MLGLETWFNNFTQMSHYLYQSPLKLTEIPRPGLEYAIYWTIKSAQVSSVIGGLLVHPAYRFYLLRQLKPETTTSNSKKIIRNQCRRVQGRFLLAGLAIGPLISILWSKINGWSRDELVEKCYQIRCDYEGLTMDRSACLFFIIGWYWKRFQGAVDGINFSLLYSLAYIGYLKDHTNEFMVNTLKKENLYKTAKEGINQRTELVRFLSSKEKSE